MLDISDGPRPDDLEIGCGTRGRECARLQPQRGLELLDQRAVSLQRALGVSLGFLQLHGALVPGQGGIGLLGALRQGGGGRGERNEEEYTAEDDLKILEEAAYLLREASEAERAQLRLAAEALGHPDWMTHIGLD